jgi:flagellar basal-body rod protein FlgC
MISSLQSPLSALQAYGMKIRANADNVANSGTEGYKRTRVTLANREPYGVQATASKPDIPGPMVYEQTTDALELIEQSNVDLGREFPEMMLNSHFYTANLKALQAADKLLGDVLNLKA